MVLPAEMYRRNLSNNSNSNTYNNNNDSINNNNNNEAERDEDTVIWKLSLIERGRSCLSV
jgi:hypothetical protein